MAIINIEFKAKTINLDDLERKLLSRNPVFAGTDHQVDTYFKVSAGRLKLREGNLENALIYYDRQNTAGIKQSDILLYSHKPDPSLKEILTKVHGIKVVVNKQRKIYFMENVKFHFDRVEELGTFIEVEAIGERSKILPETLKRQCSEYAAFFGIAECDYIAASYSDMSAAPLDTSGNGP